MKMTSNRPYILRAIYEWIIDNQLTPYLVVEAERPDVRVPMQYVRDGKIVLDISPMAINGLVMNNKAVVFEARFSGKIFQISAPMYAVQAIYAKENGRGIVFDHASYETDEEDEPPPSGGMGGKTGGPPNLKVIK